MKNLMTLCAAALCLTLTGCGAVGAASRAVCDLAAAVPDEALALGAVVGGTVAGAPGTAAGTYAKTRPLSRACADADESLDLLPQDRTDGEGTDTASFGAGAGFSPQVAHGFDTLDLHANHNHGVIRHTPDGRSVPPPEFSREVRCWQSAPGITTCLY